jgi:regulator of sirC expression with transglutaminase-like and TPR domain
MGMKTNGIAEKDFLLLLSFLSEKNEKTLALVKSQLRVLLKAHPALKKLVSKISDVGIRKTAENVFLEFHFEEVESAFHALVSDGDDLNLERGLYLLSHLQYPDLKPNDIATPLDQMAEEVAHMIAAEQPLPTRPVNAMRRYLFEIKKFRGNPDNYADPENVFLNRVLERQVGIPIALSCVYLLVGWRLNLLAHGIGLPGHFIVGHRVPRGVVHIDPFNGGRILRKKDCEILVKRLGIAFKEGYLDPVSNRQILARTIANLLNIYTERKDTLRAGQMARLFQLLES